MVETTINSHLINHENVVHRAFVDWTQLQPTLRLMAVAKDDKRIKAATMEETQNRRVHYFPDEDGLAHVLLEVAQIVLAKAGEIGVPVSVDRLVACVDHASQMVCILHTDHVHSVDHCNLDGGEIVEPTLRFQLAQSEGRRDDQITGVKVRKEFEVASRQTDSNAEAI